MKYILLLTLLLNSHLLASSQVVLGTYSTNKGAIDVKVQIDTIISKDLRFKNFLVKNSIKSIVKEKGKYFIVSLEPINDIVTQHAILNRVKKTKFKDAYVLQMKKEIIEDEVLASDQDLLTEEEPAIEDIKVTPSRVNATIERTITPKTITPIHSNMLEEYFNEVMAIIAILILSIIYLIIKKKQHTKDEYQNLNLSSKEDLVQIDDSYELKEESNDEDNNIYEMQDNNEIIFDALDETEKKETSIKVEDIIPISTTSNITKKQVPKHEKIIKSNFRDFEGIRIMIAEDNIINQKVINGLLSDSGIDIVTLNDGQEVLNFLEKDNDFSIILMDAHMPNIDGYEATRVIRANPNYSHITVVALSGDTAQDDIKNMKEVGMQEHLEKPLKMDPLYDVLYAYSIVQSNYEKLDTPLSIEDGINVCGGDEEFYKEILSDFIKDNSESTKQIGELLDNKEFSKAQELLLDLMGVTANIGAIKIQELAQKLKLALTNPNDNKYLDIFKDYTKNYKNLEKEVKEYL